MPIVNCANCGNPKTVRQADINRGWGRFCTKRCKAIDQTRRTGQGAPEWVLEDMAREADPALDAIIFDQDAEWDDDDSTYWNGKE